MAIESELHEFGRRGRERQRKRLKPVGPKHHEAVQKGKEAQVVLDAAGPLYFDSRRDQLIEQAFTEIRASGAIQPEVAVRILTQLFEHDVVLRDLKGFVREGERAGERISSLKSENQ